MATTRENSSVSLAKTSSSTERRSLLFNKSEYPGFHQAFYGQGDDDLDGDGGKVEPLINLNETLPRRSRKKDKHGDEAERRGRRKSRIKFTLLHRKPKKEDSFGENGMLTKEDDEDSNQMFRPGTEREVKGSDLEQDPSKLFDHSEEYSDSDSESESYELDYEEYYRETNDDITKPRPVETGFDRKRSDRLQQNLDEHQLELNRKIQDSKMRGKKSRKVRKENRKEKRDRKKLEKKDRTRGKKNAKKIGKNKIKPAVEKLENLRKNFKPSLNLNILHHKGDDETEEGHELVL